MNLLRNHFLSVATYQRREFFKRWNELSREYPDLSWQRKSLRIFSELPERPVPRLGSIRFVALCDDDYPEELRQLPQPPLGLFVQGVLTGPRAAVIGSRKPTLYARRLTRDIASDWTRRGLTIVSGGAIGIDAEAHMAALEEGGKTIVVLGGGHSHLHPRSHQLLFSKVLHEGGALVSEYPPHFMPRPYTFPERNRIIAAMSEVLFLAQAHEKSGSLSTARTALDLGKEIFVLRPVLGDENFKGSVQLIEAGAKPVLSASETIPNRWLQHEPL